MLKVGDTVTWRGGKSRKNEDGSLTIPLGICNCTILEFGKAEGTDEPAARIQLPPMFNENGKPTIAAALVADLEV